MNATDATLKTIEDCRRVAVGVIGEHPDSDVVRAGVLLLAALIVGTNVKRLRAFTGLPWTVIHHGSWYARRCGIWPSDNMFEVEWADGEVGDIAFVMDACVVAGRFIRDGGGYRLRCIGDYYNGCFADDRRLDWAKFTGADERERRRLARAERKAAK